MSKAADPETAAEMEPESESVWGEQEPEQSMEPTTEAVAEAEPEGATPSWELLLPSILALGAVVLVLLIYSKVWTRINQKKLEELRLVSCPQGLLLRKHPAAIAAIAIKPRTFLTEQDCTVIREFFTFRNSTVKVLKLGLPAMMSLFFLPFALLLYHPLIAFFWGAASGHSGSVPNVNDAILCYLTPAGFIYAVAFGFAYQEAVSKQKNISDLASRVVGSMQQLCEMVKLCQLTPQSSVQAYGVVKDNCVRFIKAMMEASENHKGRHRFEGTLIGLAHRVQTLSAAQRDEVTPETRRLNECLLTEILTKCIETDTHIISRWPALEGRIKTFHWLFLVILGYFAFFGILLLQAKSNALEQTMCLLTVITISLFSYVLADLDSPFHGVFTVNVDILTDFVFKIEKYVIQ